MLFVASPHHIDGCMFHCILLYSVIFHYVPWLMPLPSYCNIPSYCIISTYSDGNIYIYIFQYTISKMDIMHIIAPYCITIMVISIYIHIISPSSAWFYACCCKSPTCWVDPHDDGVNPPKMIQNIWYMIYDICDRYIHPMIVIYHDSYISWCTLIHIVRYELNVP